MRSPPRRRKEGGRRASRPPQEARADLEPSTPGDDRVVWGRYLVQALLDHQPQRILELLIDNRRAGGALAEFVAAVQARGNRCRFVSRDHLDRAAGGPRHQGVAARVRPYPYAELEELAIQGPGVLLVLDGFEDPRNLGAAARAALALGATGLVIPRDRAARVTATAEHVAAGALSQLPVAQVTNLARALDTVKERGYWVVVAEADAPQHPWEVDLTSPVAIVIGGEDRGVRRNIRGRGDHVVAIPMSASGLTLNAADAAGILLYETARQRARAASQGGRER